MSTQTHTGPSAVRTSIASGIAAILLLFGAVLQAATGTVMPSPYQTLFDSNGNPVSGGCVWTYVAGTSTPVATYTDVGLTAPNTNPIVADSAGRWVAFLTVGSSYKFTYETACTAPAHGSVIKTVDNVSAVPASSTNAEIVGTAGETIGAGKVVYLSDGSGGKTAGFWYLADNSLTYGSTLPEIGMTSAAIANGTTGQVRLAGLMDGLSGLVAGTTYYVGTSGSLTSTAPTNARIVGVADTTVSLVLDPYRSDRPPITQITTVTGTQNNFALTAGVRYLYVSNGSDVTFTGFAAGFDGQRVVILSIGLGRVELVHQSASSTAANRFINFATSGNTPLAAGIGTAEIVYAASDARWRLVAHEQGDWISPTFSAGFYGGSGTLTWTLTIGDVATQRYWVKGRNVIVQFALDTTSTGGAASTDLRISNTAYGSFTAAAVQSVGHAANSVDAGAAAPAFAQVNASSTFIRIIKVTPGNWSNAAANNTTIYGEINIEVQ